MRSGFLSVERGGLLSRVDLGSFDKRGFFLVELGVATSDASSDEVEEASSASASEAESSEDAAEAEGRGEGF